MVNSILNTMGRSDPSAQKSYNKSGKDAEKEARINKQSYRRALYKEQVTISSPWERHDFRTENREVRRGLERVDRVIIKGIAVVFWST